MKNNEGYGNTNIPVKNKIELDKNIKIAPFKNSIRKTAPHKHDNYFEIVYLSRGDGFHFIDNFRYKVEPPVMFFVRKEQVHYWELTQEPQGYVIIVKKSFIEKTLDKQLKSLFSNVSGLSSINISKTDTIERIFELLTSENKTQTDQTFTITEGLLKALISKVLEIAKPTLLKSEVKPDLYHAFLNLLNAGMPLKNKITHYAGELNTSPQNLNAVCRKIANQSATEVLSEFILSEAKRLLIYTSKTVSEIAHELDFSDASHFIKYFKKATRQTPQKFRFNA
ncbi:MAG: helix-turn-helix domain-containing protein [Cryomorphaceae bacterium]|nr:helix-turn-helix domain-containing protein [Cryomorphaceae bacterium]